LLYLGDRHVAFSLKIEVETYISKFERKVYLWLRALLLVRF